MGRQKTRTSGKEHFAGIPDSVIESESFRKLSFSGTKLLILLAYQYRGRNNGALAATYKQLKEFGFGSQHTINRALQELIKSELIMKTREGYFQHPGGRCSFYALTWWPIDDCNGKRLDVRATTRPPRIFRAEKTQNPVQ